MVHQLVEICNLLIFSCVKTKFQDMPASTHFHHMLMAAFMARTTAREKAQYVFSGFKSVTNIQRSFRQNYGQDLLGEVA
jgi:hypothetical protein